MKLIASLLLFAICGSTADAQIFGWRRHSPVTQNVQIYLVPNPQAQQVAPAPSQPPVLIYERGAPPQQQLPIVGQPQQQLPIQGAPQQILPIQGAPQQQLPIQGQPQQVLPAPGQPQQQLPPIISPPQQQLPPQQPQQQTPLSNQLGYQRFSHALHYGISSRPLY